MKSTHAAKERAFADAARNERKAEHLRTALKAHKALPTLRRLLYHNRRSEVMSRKYFRLVKFTMPEWY